MKKYLILLLAILSSTLAFAGHRHHSRVNCAVFHIDATASQPFHESIMLKTRCVTRMSHGYPIPDPNCTPGSINPTVTLNVLQNRHFRTSCMRNHVTSEHEKAETYYWYAISHPRHNTGKSQVCELDHLVPLELGGADTLNNIWPQCGPNDVKRRLRYFKQKDIVENYLAKMVKEGKMNLRDAQKGIATDWTQYLTEARNTCPFGKCK